jgi:hypothetical protein
MHDCTAMKENIDIFFHLKGTPLRFESFKQIKFAFLTSAEDD